MPFTLICLIFEYPFHKTLKTIPYMLRIHRVAAARILGDVIKADRIIDKGEMACWMQLCQKYSINKDIEVEARNMTLACALDTVRQAPIDGFREEVLADCQAMALSDGSCAHSEASLMTALSLILKPEGTNRIEMFSIPREEFNIDLSTVLYIESDYDTETNRAITCNYRLLHKELHLAGFHFVYLPQIIEHYRSTDKALFKNILSFLAPYLGSTGIDGIYHSLLNMTTSRFCRDLLCNKLGLTQLHNTYPSLLIKVADSYVAETQYSNYLKIEVDENIVNTVQTFVDTFSRLLSTDVFTVSATTESDTQFHFHGFYKQLLDIFLIRKNVRSTILIDPYQEEIFFPEIDSKATGLHRREKALYALMLCYGMDGANFSTPKDIDQFKRHQRSMQKLQKRYSAIYSMFGGTADSAPDLSAPEIRRPMISRIKRALKQLPALYNAADYSIAKDDNGVLTVHIEPQLVMVQELSPSQAVPLLQSDLYQRFTNA